MFCVHNTKLTGSWQNWIWHWAFYSL